VKVVAAVATGLAVALLLSEAAMQPSNRDRWQLVAVFGGVGLLAVVVALVLRRWSPGSLRTAVLATALAAVAVTAVAVVAAATSMFLSGHDLKLMLVALGLGITLGVVVALTLSGGLLADLRAIRSTAAAVAAGDRTARTGVERRDEIGALAATLDEAVRQLGQAEAERHETDTARRQFLESVGHDLRTPLTSLRTAIEALQDGLASDPDRYLAAMRQDVELLSVLVEDLFLLARIESGVLELDRQVIDLAELADGVIETTLPIARRRHVEISFNGPGAVPVVGDPGKLSRVLRNLLDNAVRYAPNGSTVRVQVDAETRPTVTITDEGPGFSEDFLAVAFDRFTRADEARVRDGSGAGLGLAIARGIVQVHGGDIVARPGPGGAVTVTLPPLDASHPPTA
jgi:two-component system, OmpR family, sensor histidine kinase BaeS